MASGSCQRFRVTHPHHPLAGKEFDLVERNARTGGDRVYFQGNQSRIESIPVEWTDMAPEDPFVVLSAGRAYFRVEDLLKLSSLLASLRGKAGPEEELAMEYRRECKGKDAAQREMAKP